MRCQVSVRLSKSFQFNLTFSHQLCIVCVRCWLGRGRERKGEKRKKVGVDTHLMSVERVAGVK